MNVNGTLVIHNVDLILLKKQHIHLAQICANTLPEKQRGALEGILCMLDAWADERDGVSVNRGAS